MITHTEDVQRALVADRRRSLEPDAVRSLRRAGARGQWSPSFTRGLRPRSHEDAPRPFRVPADELRGPAAGAPGPHDASGAELTTTPC